LLGCALVLSAVFFLVAATTAVFPLSLHDALPICSRPIRHPERSRLARDRAPEPVSPARAAPAADDAVARGSSLGRGSGAAQAVQDRKSTRLNSSHRTISYAVFCLKKKKQWHTRSL